MLGARIVVFISMLVGCSMAGEPLSLNEPKRFASKKVQERELRLWRSESSNYNALRIEGKRDTARFTFDGSGGSIGRIAHIKKPRLLDEVNITVSGSLTGIDQRAGRYMWGIYGWALDKKEWEDSKVRHEFYIIHSTNYKEKDALVGRVNVNGLIYRMHRHQFSNGSFRYKAIAETLSEPSVMTTIDIGPFIQYWKNQGMDNARYAHEISWALELLTDETHQGEVELRWLE